MALYSYSSCFQLGNHIVNTKTCNFEINRLHLPLSTNPASTSLAQYRSARNAARAGILIQKGKNIHEPEDCTNPRFFHTASISSARRNGQALALGARRRPRRSAGRDRGQAQDRARTRARHIPHAPAAPAPPWHCCSPPRPAARPGPATPAALPGRARSLRQGATPRPPLPRRGTRGQAAGAAAPGSGPGAAGHPAAWPGWARLGRAEQAEPSKPSRGRRPRPPPPPLPPAQPMSTAGPARPRSPSPGPWTS